MKKLLSLLFIIVLSANFCSCSKNNVPPPSEEQIKSICELATLKCYYNNVAKGTKNKGTGWQHLLEKDREFWVEYEGYAKIGVKMDLVSMKIDEENIKITMPPSEILEIGINEKTLNENSYTISEDSFWNKNSISPEEQQKAINDTQKEMEETVLKNKVLFEKADQEAKIVIESYIKNLGKLSGKTYNITWKKSK